MRTILSVIVKLKDPLALPIPLLALLGPLMLLATLLAPVETVVVVVLVKAETEELVSGGVEYDNVCKGGSRSVTCDRPAD